MTMAEPRRVVIVEDDERYREALGDLVDSDPSLALVGTAETAPDGLALIRRLRPHACLCDVRMPGGGGAALTLAARVESPSTVVIAISAYDDLDTVVSMLRAGAQSYIVKGGSGSELLDSIHRALSGQSTVPVEALGVMGEALRRVTETHTHEIEERVRHVLDNVLLEMAYQPVIDLHDHGRVLAVEALARFKAEPEQPPDRWFDDAASCGLGLDLELLAVERALLHLDHSEERLHINVSPATAMSVQLAQLLGEHDLSRVVLEITEHDRVDDYGELGRRLDVLRARGLALGIDDAGAGFASLKHVVHLQPQVIKLDISLVRDVHVDRARLAMARALNAFAQSMDAVLVAEGVEVDAERDALVGLGVPAAQGYLFGRPARCPRCPLVA